jgi:hypothetical protein
VGTGPGACLPALVSPAVGRCTTSECAADCRLYDKADSALERAPQRKFSYVAAAALSSRTVPPMLRSQMSDPVPVLTIALRLSRSSAPGPCWRAPGRENDRQLGSRHRRNRGGCKRRMLSARAYAIRGAKSARAAPAPAVFLVRWFVPCIRIWRRRRAAVSPIVALSRYSASWRDCLQNATRSPSNPG